MRTRRRSLSLLIIGILSFLVLIGLLYFFSPTATITISDILSNVPAILNTYVKIPTMALFFVLLAVFLFSIISFIFKSKIHGVLAAAFVTIYLLFRLNHLTHPFFLILLLALFVTLELFASNRKD
jgi:hypothetical protein